MRPRSSRRCATSFVPLAPDPGPVAVVGGGIAGLTAALTLHQAGVPFVLFEGTARLGGVIRTERLLLRPLRSDDAEPLFALFANWQVIRWLSLPPWHEASPMGRRSLAWSRVASSLWPTSGPNSSLAIRRKW